MIKAKELSSGDNQRFTREGSLEVSSKNYEQGSAREGSVDKAKFDDEQGSDRERSVDKAKFDDGDQWTEESDDDEADFGIKRAEPENFEKDEAVDYPFESKEVFNQINESPTFINTFGCTLANTINGVGTINLTLAVIAILLGSYMLCTGQFSNFNNVHNNNNNNVNNLHEMRVKHFLNTIKEIKLDFPSQENILWKSVFQKIKYVNESEPTRPAVLILLYNKNKEVAECIAWRIGKAASTFLNTPGVIELIGDSDMRETDNELVTQYRDPLKKNGIMIVYRLDEIPGLVAQSFHAFCDTYNPLVKRAVLLFTLDHSRLKDTQDFKPTKKATEILKLLWRDKLVDSKLNSLITRLTDTVLEVNFEKNVKC